MAYDPNQAHPKIDYKGTYPNMHVTQRADGSQEIRSLEPGNESYFEVQASGSYTGHGPNGEEVSVTVSKKHHYVADGHSTTVDGHHDQKISGSKRATVSQGNYAEIGGNHYHGSGGVSISGSHDSHIHSTPSGDHFNTTEGNIVTDHTGSVHHNITGDYIKQVTGHKVEMITGEYGINNQNGNFDVQVDNGKLRLKATSDVLINSDSSITLQVGGSKIVITPSDITIYAAGRLNLQAAQNVITKGSQTDLQGGGPVGVPVTIR